MLVTVAVLVAVLVGVLVGVLVDVFVGVLVDVLVGVLVEVLVGVLVGVSVGVFVGVLVGGKVEVEVGVGVSAMKGVIVGNPPFSEKSSDSTVVFRISALEAESFEAWAVFRSCFPTNPPKRMTAIKNKTIPINNSLPCLSFSIYRILNLFILVVQNT